MLANCNCAFASRTMRSGARGSHNFQSAFSRFGNGVFPRRRWLVAASMAVSMQSGAGVDLAADTIPAPANSFSASNSESSRLTIKRPRAQRALRSENVFAFFSAGFLSCVAIDALIKPGAAVSSISVAPHFFRPLNFRFVAAPLSTVVQSRAASTPRSTIARMLGAAPFNFSPSPFARYEVPALRLFHRKVDLKKKATEKDSYGDEHARGQRI
jgi:hypothetical protein